MNRSAHSFALLIGLFCLLFSSSGCAHLGYRRSKPAPPAAPAPHPKVGVIHAVYQDAGFALIKLLPDASVPSGATLTAGSSDGTPAVLKAGMERRRAILAADLVRGQPEQGAEVFLGDPPEPEAADHTR